MSEITLDEYKICLNSFNVIDCAVRDRNAFYFVAREDYTKWPTSKWDSENEPPPDEEDILKHVIGFSRPEKLGKKWDE